MLRSIPILISSVLFIGCWNKPNIVELPNADFELHSNTSATGLEFWKQNTTDLTCTADSAEVYDGRYSMHAKNEGNGMVYFYQEFPFTSHGLKKYRLTVAIKSGNSNGNATEAGIKIVDAEGNSVSGFPAIRTDSVYEWQEFSGDFFSDETAVKIKVYGLLQSKGEAWFDNFRIEEIPMSDEELHPEVEAYLDSYFVLVRMHSMVKDTELINLLETRAKLLCAGHNDIAYGHEVLKRYITIKLNDGHSFFLKPEEWKTLNSSSGNMQQGTVLFPSGDMLDEGIAYISVPTFTGLDSELVQLYIDSMQNIIARLDVNNPSGWIIDLSNNEGGNSYAMLPGLGALIGNGISGYSESADGTRLTRTNRDGWMGWNDDAICMTKRPYHLKNPGLPIAIIYSHATASSGEEVAIAFRGLKNTASFGQETAGATTRIDNFAMPDSAYLNLACGFSVDRNGTALNGKIKPDYEAPTYEEAMAQAHNLDS